MKYASFFLIAVLFANCQSAKQTQQDNPNAPFETIQKSSYGGKETQVYDIIRSKEELDETLKTFWLEAAAKQKLEQVDFKNQLVLSLHSGTHNTGGYAIEVSNVEVKGDTTYVTVNKTSPAPGENVTMALTNPYCIVVIDKNETIIFK